MILNIATIIIRISARDRGNIFRINLSRVKSFKLNSILTCNISTKNLSNKTSKDIKHVAVLLCKVLAFFFD